MRIVQGSRKIPIGVTHYRRSVLLNLDRIPHTKVVGVTGSGKSEALRSMIYFLCRQLSPKQAELNIIDLKGGATYIQFAHLPHVRRIYRTTNEALTALIYCERVMWERLDMIYEARKAFRPDPKFPLLVLMIDEGGEMSPADSTGEEKAIRTQCMQILSTLVRVGREPGLRVIYATQRPDRYTLPMTVRSQLENTLCFRVAEHYESEIALGHDGAERLPRIPGRMIYRTPDQEVQVQGVFVPQDVIEAWLRSYAKPETVGGNVSGLSTAESMAFSGGFP